MRRVDRTIMAVVLAGLLVSGLGRIGQCKQHASETDPRATHAISGSLDVSGVIMEGLPGRPVTDQSGQYRAEVEHGWTGTVTPQKPGYLFEPPNRIYESVQSDFEAQDYRYRRPTFTIAGSVGVPGAVMRGLPGDPVTDAQGRYSVAVDYAWSGTVEPMKEGYEFRPTRTTYTRIVSDQRQDFTASILTFVIGGTVYGDGDRAGVAIEGLPGHPLTDSQGRYRATVAYGWSGMVRPARIGYHFEPAERQYAHVTADQGDHDYASKAQMVIISDVIGMPEPIEGVTVTPDPGGDFDVTDFQGRFVIRVPYGWTGDLKLTKEGYDFPNALRYSNVTHHLIDGERTPASEEPVIPTPRATAISPRPVVPTSMDQVLVIPTAEVAPERFAEVAEDMGVMLHIVREKLNERMVSSAPYGLYDYGDFFGGDQDSEAIYLQGYAILFVMHSDLPFAFPAQGAVTSQQRQAEKVDPVWQRARQRLYSPPNPTGYRQRPGQGQEMDLDRFKDELLRTLRHAANIRHIDPNEQVIVTILAQNATIEGHSGPVGSTFSGGSGHWFEGGTYSISGGSFGTGGGSTYADSSVYSRGAGGTRPRMRVLDPYGTMRRKTPATPPTALTIQARKSDIDAFAADELNFEQFRQRVRTFTY